MSDRSNVLRNVAATLAAVLVVAGLALWWVQREPHSSASASSNVAGVDDGDEAEPGERRHASSAGPEDAAGTDDDGMDEPPEEGWFRVEGTLRMIPALDDAETVTFFLRPVERRDLLIPVTSRGGPFSAWVPDDGRYAIDGLQRAIYVGALSGEFTPGGVVDIRRGVPLAITLSYSREHEVRVTLLGPEGQPVVKPVFRESDGLIVGASNLPLAFPNSDFGWDLEKNDDGTYRVEVDSWVRAKGCAWQLLPAPGSAEMTLQLEPGGTLSLHVPGWTELLRPSIWLRRSDGTVGELPGLDEGKARWEGVPVGDHTLEVRRGLPTDGRDGPLFGRASVHVRPDAVTEVSIDTDPGDEVRPLPMRIELTITDPALFANLRKPTRQRVRIGGLGGLAAGIGYLTGLHDLTSGETVVVATEPLPPGPYIVTLGQSHFEAEIEHRTTDTHRLIVPAPGTLIVEILDAETGLPIPGAESGVKSVRQEAMTRAIYEWSGSGREGPMPFSVYVAGLIRSLPVDAPHALLAPGRYRVSATADGYAGRFHAFVPNHEPGEIVEIVDREETRVQYRLRREATLTVHLRLDGKELPDLHSIRVMLRRGDEERELMYWGDHASSSSLTGRWTVHVPRVVGYEVPAPVAVDLVPGETREVVVDLPRRR